MSLLAQIGHALVMAPLAPLRLRPRALAYLLLYVALAGAILGGLAWFLVSHQDELKLALLRYLLPESWTKAGELLLDWLLATQTRAVLINATVSGTLVLISVLLFPLKEQVSAAYEQGARLTDEPAQEFPLWFQGLEELKLVVLYATVQMAILWVGYHPSPARKLCATALSYGFLFAAFAIDFVSPLLQRHRLRYSQILKTLLRHPAATLLFGAVFSLPALLAAHHVARAEQMPFDAAIQLLFAANLLGIVWGCIGGTWLGAKLLEPARATPVSARPVRLLAWVVLIAAFASGSYVSGRLALSVHHKTQILKCNYSVVPGSLAWSRPRLGGLLRGVAEVGVRLKLSIENPTPFDLELEHSRLEVRHEKTLVATTRLSPLRVPAGQRRVQPVALSLELRPAVLRKGRALLRDRWSVTLFVQVMQGLDFPIYLRHTFADSLRQQLLGED